MKTSLKENSCGQGVLALSCALGAIVCTGVSFGDTIPSSILTDSNAIKLTTSSSGDNNGFTNATHWTAVSGTVVVPQNISDPLAPNPAAASKIYVIPSGKDLRTYKEPVSKKMPGAVNGRALLAGGAAWHLEGSITPATAYWATPLSFPSLTVYDDSYFGVNAVIGLSNTAVIVKSTNSKPFILAPNSDAGFVLDRCTFTGESNAGLKFRDKTPKTAALPYAIARLRNCDFTAFKGQLELNWPTSSDYNGMSIVCESGSFSMPEGTLLMHAHSIAKVRSENVSHVKTIKCQNIDCTVQTGYQGRWEIDNLVLAADTALSYQGMTQQDEPFMTITTTLDLVPSAVYQVVAYADESFGTKNSGRRFPLFKKNAGVKDSSGNTVTLSLGQFALASAANFGFLSLETAEDGAQTLWYTEPIYQAKTDSTTDSTKGTTAGAAFKDGGYWKDGNQPHGDAWYVVPGGSGLNPNGLKSYTFPGLGLAFEDAASLTLNGNMTQFFVTNMIFAGSTTISDYTPYKTYFPGKIELRGGTLTMHEYSMGTDTDNGGDVFTGNVSGSGTIVARWRGKDVNYGRFEMTGTNVNYTGKVQVCCYGWNSSNSWEDVNYTPLSSKHLRVVVTDQRNFGGAIPAGATTPVYDALTVRDRQILHADGRLAKDRTVVFDEPSRGIYVPWWGRFRVDANDTLTIKQQLTYEGKFQKIGKGTLALGGTAKFTKNLLDTPYVETTLLAGTNVLDISEGALKPLSANAFAGVAVVFSNATELVLDPATTDADLKAYGLKASAAGSSVSVPTGTVTLRGLTKPNDAEQKVAVATFATPEAAEAFKAKLAVPSLKGATATLGVEANETESALATVYATVRLRGAIIYLR